MKSILGTKGRMTQIFDEQGVVQPVTEISVSPNTVTQIKNAEKDGYHAVQLACGEQKVRRVSAAQRGHFKKATGDDNAFQVVREVRLADADPDVSVGQQLTVDSVFEPGDAVTVSAVSKGKGFQGVVKRHGFHGGPRTHGQKHGERSPGSIGSTGPQRVFKGTKMAGRMGGNRVTVKNLAVVAVDADEHKLYVRGAVPGRPGSVVEISKN